MKHLLILNDPPYGIRHAIPPPNLGRLLAGASHVRNIVNQWVAAAAYILHGYFPIGSPPNLPLFVDLLLT